MYAVLQENTPVLQAAPHALTVPLIIIKMRCSNLHVTSVLRAHTQQC